MFYTLYYLLLLVYFYALLFAYDSANGDTDLFHDALKRITSMLLNNSIEATDPDSALNWIMNNFETYPIDTAIESSDIYKLLLNEVVNDNEFDTVEFDTVGVSGFDPIAPALKKAGMYFIYLFIPESELNKYPDVVGKKRKTQNALFKIIHTVDIFHSSQTVLNFFRAGIVAKTGMQPEKYIADVKLKNVRQSIGIAIETITAILGALYSLIIILSKLLPKLENEHIVLTHLSRRTDMQMAKKMVQKNLAPELVKKIHFLMARPQRRNFKPHNAPNTNGAKKTGKQG